MSVSGPHPESIPSQPTSSALRGRRVLIVGGSSGIGLALSGRLAAQGSHVVATGRDAARLEALPDAPNVVRRVLADAADFDAVDDLVRELASEDPGLHGIVNCAGSILIRPAHLTRAGDLDETLRQNLVTAFSVVRAAARQMTAGGGSVVLFSTAAVRLGLAAHEAIAAAKGGIEAMVRSAAASYAARGLRFNAVAPGLVDTPMSERIVASEAGRNASISLHALGRLGTPDDVAAMAAFLLDPAHDWITGQVIGVDGGLGSVRSRAG